MTAAPLTPEHLKHLRWLASIGIEGSTAATELVEALSAYEALQAETASLREQLAAFRRSIEREAKAFAERALRQWCPNESGSGKLAAMHVKAIAEAIAAAERETT